MSQHAWSKATGMSAAPTPLEEFDLYRPDPFNVKDPSVLDSPLKQAMQIIAALMGAGGDPNLMPLGMVGGLKTRGEILSEARQLFSSASAKEFAERTAWVRKVDGPNAVVGEPMRRPRTVGAKQATDYIARYFPGWKTVFSSKSALHKALKESNASVGQGKFGVSYAPTNRSFGNEGGVRPISFDKYSLEDIENWIAGLIADK